ncbi:class I SAM-dependent methyltransferase [Methylobacterium sp. J-088]|uniref:class I SAM-dependent methyltransferase n=1 Tax=Methylobacterium sp. J-088 TaxID=2836664 RepID=UPI001FBAF31D|nr:class I SAM-dependent methyltransferase [Methylobacterium sp. J-088]MCJ2067054.1 class I SAM-dependent methyltransferase [Methylobacterium sp. J-088]
MSGCVSERGNIDRLSKILDAEVDRKSSAPSIQENGEATLQDSPSISAPWPDMWARLENDVNIPTLIFSDDVPWQMSRWEKYTLNAILQNLKPVVSIEIGRYKGGSLQIISEHSQTVYSIDLDDSYTNYLSQKYKNVEFIHGRSPEVICDAMRHIDKNGHNFILIDGDHSEKGVADDINAILNFNTQASLIILMHDSFNPECRSGILKAKWKDNRNVSFLEIDFVPGSLHKESFDQASGSSMWGGFACALIGQEQNQKDLLIFQSQKNLFELAMKSIQTPDTRTVTEVNSIYKLHRDFLEHENNLVNQRTTWLMTTQSFLMAIFGLSFKGYLDLAEKYDPLKIENSESISYLWSFKLLFVLFALVGLAVSKATIDSVQSARKSLKFVGDNWTKNFMHDTTYSENLPPIIGPRSIGIESKKVSLSVALPRFFIMLWSVVSILIVFLPPDRASSYLMRFFSVAASAILDIRAN